MGLFSSSTEIDVFVNISRLNTGEPINAVTLALANSINTGSDFSKVETEDFLPNSQGLGLLRIAQKLDQEDPDYHPFGLPTLKFTGIPGIPDQKGLGVFWIRNKNIDLDSVWWNAPDELGIGNIDRPTRHNDNYWIRDPDDPDRDTLPEDGDPLLTDRPYVTRGIFSGFGGIGVGDMVPYELVHPDHFKLHPEFAKTKEILDGVGLDVKPALESVRQGDSNKDIDYMLYGNFLGLMPRRRADAFYMYEFFRLMFKDLAFANNLPKQTSPCVTHALSKNGFYDKSGNNLGFISNNSNTLSGLKNENFYYQYSGVNDPHPNLTELFVFQDPRRDMKLTFKAEEILVRKVKGRLRQKVKGEYKYLNHGMIKVVIGKGANIPEFTYFVDAVYPTNPTVSPPAYTSAQLTPFDDAVTAKHRLLFKGLSSFINKDPEAYISIQIQKDFSGSIRGTHDWDFENKTSLNANNKSVYYEEIIIVDPRTKYQGVYSESHQSRAAYKVFHAGGAEDVFWETSDQNKTYWHHGNDNRYYIETIGSRFDGDFGDSDVLTIPISFEVAKGIRAKEREDILATSLSIMSISIVKTKTSSFDKFVAAAVTLASIYFAVTGFVGFVKGFSGLTLQQAAAKIAWQAVKVEAASIVADELVDILIDLVGEELAGDFIIAFTVYSTIKGVGSGALLNPAEEMDFLWMVNRNIDDSYIQDTQDDIDANVDQFEKNEKSNLRKSEDLMREYGDILKDVDPNFRAMNLSLVVPNESPGEFLFRTVGIDMLGIQSIDKQRTEIARSLLVTPEETPPIFGDEKEESDYVKNLV